MELTDKFNGQKQRKKKPDRGELRAVIIYQSLERRLKFCKMSSKKIVRLTKPKKKKNCRYLFKNSVELEKENIDRDNIHNMIKTDVI